MITLAQALKILNEERLYLRPINGGVWDYYNFSIKDLTNLLDCKKTKVYYIKKHFSYDFSEHDLELIVNLPKETIEKLYRKKLLK